MSNISISGAVSGLDTASIINSLVQVEGNQQTLLKSQQSSAQKASDAYAQLITQLGSLGTEAKGLANTSGWQTMSATSSSSSVSVAATGNSSAYLTFDVTALAAAHTLISADTVGSTGDVVASGPLTLTKNDGSTTSIDVGSGSLADVVNAINSANAGISAAAVQTGQGQYRLQVAATGTGAASQFTLDGLDGFTGMNVLTQGQDAAVTVGTDPNTSYQATSATNTFANLLPGLSFTVSKLETGVTVSSSRDGTAVANQISTLVSDANKLLNQIGTYTAWDATKKSGGPLLGDSAVRLLQENVLSLVSSSGAPGLSVTRYGQVTFDSSAFLTAFKANPQQVMDQFGVNSTFAANPGMTGTVKVVSAGDSSRAGSYAVSVLVNAAAEQWKLQPPGGIIAGQTVVLMRGSQVVTYTAGPNDTLADAVAAINTQTSGVGFGVTAVVDGSGNLQFTANVPGAGSAFTASLNGVAGTQVTAGLDVQGTIDGKTALGVGNTLSLPNSPTSGANGLVLSVTASDADVAATGGNVGTVSYQPGFAQRLVTLLNQASSSNGGSLVTAQQGTQATIKDLQKQIDTWDTRLATYRSMLQTQFTAMETALATLKSQSNFLTSTFSGTTTTGGSSGSSGTSGASSLTG